MTISHIPEGTTARSEVTADERQLAARNHGFLMEALQYPTTPIGLHYLLIHYDVPAVDASTWKLEIGGLVQRPLSLSLEDIRARPSTTRRVTFECAGNGRMMLQPRPLSQPWGVEAVATAEWTGTPLRGLLEEAGVRADALDILFSGLDTGIEDGVEQRYERSLTVTEAQREEVILAYGINGQPLPPQHGFPLRLVVPGWYGMTNVKWLSSITAIDHHFEGYQQRQAYCLRQEAGQPGTPLDRMRPRALMVPPGIPDFFTRERVIAPGPIMLQGRAWSGVAPIQRVEVTTDGGESWIDATVASQPDQYAWIGWEVAWDATPGKHALGCRATDAGGNVQPLEPEWNLGGYACNAVSHMAVTVSDA